MKRNKCNKTISIEKDTMGIVESYMKEKNFSSFSSALERIIIEWKCNSNMSNSKEDSSAKVEDKQDLSTLKSTISNIYDNMPD